VLIDAPELKYAVLVTGLLAIYYTTIRSWLDWHITMERNPYSLFQPADATSSPETARIHLDLAVVSVYAYLLLQLHTVVPNQTDSRRGYLIGFVLAFALYLASGIIRQWTHGQRASSREWIAYSWQHSPFRRACTSAALTVGLGW